MAWITKDQVKAMTPKLKAIAQKYGMKIRVGGSNSCSLKVTLVSGEIDLVSLSNPKLKDYELRGADINMYHFDKRFSGVASQFLSELEQAMKADGWYDNTDIQSDYVDIAWYIAVKVGTWEKPYTVNQK